MPWKYTLTLSFLFSCIHAFGQSFYDPQIQLGAKADSVQFLVAREVQSYYNARGWLMKMSAQTIDFQGKIKEVILTKENILVPNLNKGVNCHIHFLITQDTLSAIVTQFDNVTFNEARQMILSDRTTINMAGYFFSTDYRTYRRVFTDDKGVVFADYRKTKIAELPLNVREQLRMIAGIW